MVSQASPQISSKAPYLIHAAMESMAAGDNLFKGKGGILSSPDKMVITLYNLLSEGLPGETDLRVDEYPV